MAAMPARPVVVGAGQVVQRPGELDAPDAAREPLALMEDAVVAAIADAELDGHEGLIDAIVTVRGAWGYPDPGRAIADRMGAHLAATAITAHGGNAPGTAFNEIAHRVSLGRLSCAVLVGGETTYGRRKAREAGGKLATTRLPDQTPATRWGDEFEMSSPEEAAVGLFRPVGYYALFEDALRRQAGRTVDEQRRVVAEFWARQSRQVVNQPAAWSHQTWTADEILEVSDDNRLIAYPYSKRMCSNLFTDQAAAVVICSAEFARRHGITDRAVHVLGGSDASDTLYVGNRLTLDDSPALRANLAAVLDAAAVDAAELDYIDLYSCFSSAVQVGSRAMGLPADAVTSITGGMPYFGGPVNNYATHSIAAMVERLRSTPGSTGLVTANGGFLTKHAAVLLSTSDPRRPCQLERLGTRADDRVQGAPVGYSTTEATIEATTVLYDRGRPERLVAAALTDTGARVWGMSKDPDIMAQGVRGTGIAGRIKVRADGSIEPG